jgi:alpha-L-rhamnosidase
MLKYIFCKTILLTLIFILIPLTAEYSICKPVNLRVNYSVKPICVDNRAPFFSWQIDDAGMGAKQTAWQIIVATSPELLKEGKPDIWDSGKHLSSKNKQIAYNGAPLKSCSRYFWSVMVWDKDNHPGNFSEPEYFETAYLDPADWKGRWVTNTEDTASYYSPYIRKVIEARGKPIRATAFVAGIGYHELYVNNKKVSNTFLEPGYTRFDRRTLYLTYDITDFLTNGKNCLGVILGNGWYNVQTKAVWYFDKAPWRKSPRLLMNVRLQYADGAVEFISTDESWKFSDGPIRFNSVYGGEEYDARLEKENWSSVEFDDSKWQNVLITNSPGGILSAQVSPSIKVIRTIKPVNVFRIQNGKYLFDMGENFAGISRLQIQGKEGTKITMRFGERINPDKTLDSKLISEHMRIAAGEHPFQTDYYILKGKGREFYVPHFTYHGYQYIEVTTEPAVELTKDNMEGLFLSTGTDETGSFSCSNELINKLYSAAIQSYRSNFYSIPTDCPQREKNGWTGDAQISCETGLWNFDGIEAYRKWLQDLRDEQRPIGELPGIVPTSGWGYQWGNGPAWDSALPIIAWELYQYYGDTSVLSENYEAIKRYVDYLGTRTKDGILTIGLGDWVSITKTPVEITSTGYYYYDALTLSRMAGILGKAEDRRTYAALSEKVKTIFNKTFFNDSTNHYYTQTQTALSCALYQGLAPKQAVEETVTDLLKQVEGKNFHPDFGLLGSKYVLNALHNSGYDEIAFKMLNSTEYPGWGNWIAKGATSLFEDWAGANSLNHIFLGDFTSWYFKALGGINIDPGNPGFDSFLLKPSFIKQLSFVKCSYNSVNGNIISAWKRGNGLINWQVVIPANTNASLIIPGAYRVEKIMENNSGSQIQPVQNIIPLEAGNYNIILQEN